MPQTTVVLPAISCGHCVRTIEREIGDLPGVTRVVADASTKTASIEYDEAQVGWTEITRLLTEIGFPPA